MNDSIIMDLNKKLLHGKREIFHKEIRRKKVNEILKEKRQILQGKNENNEEIKKLVFFFNSKVKKNNINLLEKIDKLLGEINKIRKNDSDSIILNDLNIISDLKDFNSISDKLLNSLFISLINPEFSIEIRLKATLILANCLGCDFTKDFEIKTEIINKTIKFINFNDNEELFNNVILFLLINKLFLKC